MYFCKGGNRMNEIQTELLSLLKTFIQVCDNNNLQYFASGGTLLGAVRHKGFIPWDDDIDLVMPRSDFDRLTFSTALPDDYKMVQDDQLLFGSFRNTTVTITHGLNEWDDNEPYLSLDICPADGAGNNYLASIIHTLHCLSLFVLIKLKRIKYIQKTEEMYDLA